MRCRTDGLKDNAVQEQLNRMESQISDVSDVVGKIKEFHEEESQYIKRATDGLETVAKALADKASKS